MPIASPIVVGTLVPTLAGVAVVGTSVPQYARGVANGLLTWVPTIKVSTVDVGAAGTGTGVPVPITLITPLLYGNLVAGFSANGHTGTWMPIMALGLATGLTTIFAGTFTSTVHPGTGSGAGVATFTAPPAAGAFVSGFASAGMTGDGAIQHARGLAQGLQTTFASLVLAQPIVGPAGPSPGGGVGTGSII